MRHDAPLRPVTDEAQRTEASDDERRPVGDGEVPPAFSRRRAAGPDALASAAAPAVRTNVAATVPTDPAAPDAGATGEGRDLAASAKAIAAALFGEEAAGNADPAGQPRSDDAPAVPPNAAGAPDTTASPPAAAGAPPRSLTALALARVTAEAAARQRPALKAAPSTPQALALPAPGAAPTPEPVPAAAADAGTRDTPDPASPNEAAPAAALALSAPEPLATDHAAAADIAAPGTVPIEPAPPAIAISATAVATAGPAASLAGFVRTAALALWPTPRRLWWAVPLALVVLLVVRLIVAPLTVPVAGLLAGDLSARVGVPVAVERVRVRLGPGTVTVLVEGVRYEAPETGVSIDAVRLVQRLGGRTVDLVAPSVSVRRGGGPPLAMPPPVVAVAALDRALASLAAEGARSSLRGVSVEGGRLEVVSSGAPGGEERRTFEAVEATLAIGEGRIDAQVSAIGAGGLVTARLGRTTDVSGTLVSAAADGLVPADLGPARGVREGFRLAPALEATLSPDGTVTSATLSVGIGRGTVAFASDPPRTLDEGKIQFALADGGLVVENTAFVAGGSRIEVAGTITPGATPEEPWRFRLAAPGAVIEAPDIASAPVELTVLEAEGTLDMREQHIHVAALRAATAAGRADAVLDFDFTNGPHLSGAAHIGPSAIPSLLGAWPAVIAYQPRLAVMNTVLGGIVTSLDIDFALDPLELDGDPETSNGIERTMALDTTFLDATLTTPGLPLAIQRARGAMKMLDRTLSVRVDGGVVTAGEAGALLVKEGYLTIEPLGSKTATAEITATVSGPLSAVVALADRLNLPQLKENGLTAEDVTGTVEARLAMSTPLGANVPMEEREWSIDAVLTDAGSGKPLGGQTFADADIELIINPRRLAARGTATIDGIRVDVNYSELFAGEKSGGARFVLTDRDRRQKGFDTGDAVRGPVVVTVDAAAGEGAEGRAFTADLTEAEVSIPGLAKPAGEKLLAEGSLIGDGSDFTVQNLRLDGSGIDVGGTVSVDGNGLTAATLDPFALSRGDDARLAVERAGSGYRVWLEATEFDARRLVAGALKPAPKGKSKPPAIPPLTVSAKGERVILRDGAVLTDMDLEAKRGKDRFETLTFSGRVDGSNAGAVAVRLAPDGGERSLKGDVAELGRVLSALGVYDRMKRGRTTLDARIGGDGVMRGRLTVEDFALEGEQRLEDIIARAQIDGGRDPGARVLAFQPGAPSGGLAFDRLRVDFTKEGDVITIREANLRGQMLGGTADGVVDLRTGEVRLNGTLIPAYGVNNLFGRVPLVGEILGGGNQGGLIGVTFRVTGPVRSPNFSVNPLSAVAPGIFRRIFEFR